MQLTLPPDTPENIQLAYYEAVRIMGEILLEAQSNSKKYEKETRNRVYLAYGLKACSLIGAILITAGYFPHQFAIGLAVAYGIDNMLSNSKRLIATKQAATAYKAIENKMVRTHQTEQSQLLSESDKISLIKKITDMTRRLNNDAYKQFEAVEEAIKTSDIQTLQALSLDEEKLNLATKYLKKA